MNKDIWFIVIATLIIGALLGVSVYTTAQRYAELKKHYTHLTYTDFIMYSQHLHIPTEQ